MGVSSERAKKYSSSAFADTEDSKFDSVL